MGETEVSYYLTVFIDASERRGGVRAQGSM
jgi:hypothetical protein